MRGGGESSLPAGTLTPGMPFSAPVMGIGNTTPSSAIIACLSGLPAREVTGRGTGVDDGPSRGR